MNYYTSSIPVSLAEKLKEKGMPIPIEFIPNYLGDPEGEAISKIVPPSFAFVFDWLMEKGLFVVVEPYWDFADETITKDFESCVIKQGTIHSSMPIMTCSTWHEAANAAIEMALTLI